jgi:hypothetical protein
VMAKVKKVNIAVTYLRQSKMLHNLSN